MYSSEMQNLHIYVRPVTKGGGALGAHAPSNRAKLFFAYFPVKLGSCPTPPQGGELSGKKFLVLPPAQGLLTALYVLKNVLGPS